MHCILAQAVCLVTLQLFNRVLDCWCEDAMLVLVFQYLVTGSHVMQQHHHSSTAAPLLQLDNAHRILDLMPAVLRVSNAESQTTFVLLISSGSWTMNVQFINKPCLLIFVTSTRRSASCAAVMLAVMPAVHRTAPCWQMPRFASTALEMLAPPGLGNMTEQVPILMQSRLSYRQLRTVTHFHILNCGLRPTQRTLPRIPRLPLTPSSQEQPLRLSVEIAYPQEKAALS